MATYFNYEIEGVPDLDQRRRGLPESGGMFCLPTSAVNWLYFIANHGCPGAVWMGGIQPMFRDPGNYPLVTLNIGSMGECMDTDPESGTTYSDAFDGLLDLLGDRSVPAIVVCRRYADDVSIRFAHLCDAARMGGLLSVCFGRYEWNDDGFDRRGGHCMSVVGLKQADDSMLLQAHDPAQADRSIDQQSPPRIHQFSVQHRRATFEGEETTLARLIEAGESGATQKYVDCMMYIIPLFALTNVDRKILYYTTNDWGASAITQEIALPFAGEVGVLALHPALPRGVCAEVGGRDLWQLDLVTRKWSHLRAMPEPVTHVAFGGPRERLAVAQGREVVTLSGESTAERGRFTLPFKPDALGYDDARDTILAISAEERSLAEVDGRTGRVQQVPIALPGGAGAPGDLRVFVPRRGGGIHITRDGVPDVVTLRTRGATVEHQGLTRLSRGGRPILAAEGERGRFMAVEDGTIVTLDVQGQPARGPFDGLRAGRHLVVAQSWHNLQLDPSWRA